MNGIYGAATNEGLCRMEQTAVNLDVRRGLELFLAGKLADAEQACLDVLQAQSYHFGALNF